MEENARNKLEATGGARPKTSTNKPPAIFTKAPDETIPGRHLDNTEDAPPSEVDGELITTMKCTNNFPGYILDKRYLPESADDEDSEEYICHPDH